jgi:hypothetical protein
MSIDLYKNILDNCEHENDDKNRKCTITPTTTFNYYFDNAKDNIFYTIYQDKIRETNIISDKFPLCFRVGINENIKPSFMETMQNIKGKIEFIFDNLESSEEYLCNNNDIYPNNSIVVDFFINFDKNANESNNDLHMITLLKEKNDTIRIYDPTDKSYSYKICEFFNSSAKYKYTQAEYPSKKNVKENYKPKDKNDVKYSNYNEHYPSYRNCLDISVKISFHLSEILKKIKENKINILDIESIDRNIHEQLGNNKLSKPELNMSEYITIREFQSSSYHIRREALAFTKKNPHIFKKYFYSFAQIIKFINEKNIEFEGEIGWFETMHTKK